MRSSGASSITSVHAMAAGRREQMHGVACKELPAFAQSLLRASCPPQSTADGRSISSGTLAPAACVAGRDGCVMGPRPLPDLRAG